jgi:hypothetical protein
VGSDRRRTERLAALTQPRMPTSSPYLDPATHPVSVFPLARVSANRDFFARFLLDTHSASGCRSTRHSDTSRNGRKSSRCIKSARATRHLNATLVTRHSNGKITRFGFAFLSPVLRICLQFVFPSGPAHSGFCAALRGRARRNPEPAPSSQASLPSGQHGGRDSRRRPQNESCQRAKEICLTLPGPRTAGGERSKLGG